MSDYTRNAHMVRVFATDPKTGKQLSSGQFVDIEVLDAVTFKGIRGEESVLHFPVKDSVPYIVDDTGNQLDKRPSASEATCSSHIKEITDPDDKSDNPAKILVEVLDCITFKTTRGEEMVLSVPGAEIKPFNTTDGDGDDEPNCQTHSEKVTNRGVDTDEKDNYVLVERTDVMTFKTTRGEELVYEMPSSDDPEGERASTYIWNMPGGAYDPNDSDDPDKSPPSLEESGDPHVYVYFEEGANIWTKDLKINQGFKWWIRRVGGKKYFLITVKAHAENISDSALPLVDAKAEVATSATELDSDTSDNKVSYDPGGWWVAWVQGMPEPNASNPDTMNYDYVSQFMNGNVIADDYDTVACECYCHPYTAGDAWWQSPPPDPSEWSTGAYLNGQLTGNPGGVKLATKNGKIGGFYITNPMNKTLEDYCRIMTETIAQYYQGAGDKPWQCSCWYYPDGYGGSTNKVFYASPASPNGYTDLMKYGTDLNGNLVPIGVSPVYYPLQIESGGSALASRTAQLLVEITGSDYEISASGSCEGTDDPDGAVTRWISFLAEDVTKSVMDAMAKDPNAKPSLDMDLSQSASCSLKFTECTHANAKLTADGWTGDGDGTKIGDGSWDSGDGGTYTPAPQIP